MSIVLFLNKAVFKRLFFNISIDILKLIILDLDETLIHATESALEREADFRTELYHVYKRPYVDEFLYFCFQYFKVGVWTTAGRYFAQDVIKNIFLIAYPLEFVWSFQRCTRIYDSDLMQPYYIKNLKKLKRKGYCLEKIIMIDDTPQKLERNYGNLIRVKEWLGNAKDQELLLLMKYLADLKDVENIRKIEKRGWQKHYR